jgi:hypothetical protein
MESANVALASSEQVRAHWRARLRRFGQQTRRPASVDAIRAEGGPMGGILKFFGSVIGIIFLIGLLVVIGLLALIF